MSKKIQKLDIIQVRNLGSFNPIIPPVISQGTIGFKGLEDCVKVELDNLAENVDTQLMCVNG